MRLLITGGTGFLGSFSAERRIAKGDKVWVTSFEGPRDTLDDAPEAIVLPCDVTDREQLRKVLAETKPDIVFHYAAQTLIQESWADPANTLRTNVGGTLNLFEILRAEDIDARIVVACSSAEYGEIAARGMPVTEEDRLVPVSPYGLSKLDQDMLSFLFHRAYKMPIIRARIFNTIGPRKRGDFLAEFCGQIAAIEAGEREPVLRAGELNSRRDLTDVRDTVRALDLLADRGHAGQVYNICSGRTVRIGDAVDLLLGAAKVKIRVQIEETRLRPHEESIISGNNERLVGDTGWSSQVPLEQTLTDTLNYWRNRHIAVGAPQLRKV
jgi:GDP-4-dehydro-6-deoxy-D-mannose reductase